MSGENSEDFAPGLRGCVFKCSPHFKDTEAGDVDDGLWVWFRQDAGLELAQS